MSTITFGDLCRPCKILTSGLVAQWIYKVEGAFVGSGGVLDSVEAVRASVNAVWISRFQTGMFVPGSSTPEPPRVVVEPTSYSPMLLGGQGSAEYDTLQHKIVIAPDSFPISRRAVIHEIAHGIQDHESKDVYDLNESSHGETFVGIAFGLYRENGLVGAGVDPDRVANSVSCFQEEATNRTRCAFQARNDTRVKKVIRKILPSRLTRH